MDRNAYNNSKLVRFGQRIGNLRCVAQRLPRRQRPLDEALFERFAFQVFHDQEIHAVLMTNVMQCADVRMRKFGNCFGFALQPLLQRSIGGEACRQDLNRHFAIEPRVARSIHFSHAARAQRR